MAVSTELHLPSLATELVAAQSQQSDTLKESLAALKETNRMISEVEQRAKTDQLKLFAIEKDICALRCSCSQSAACAEQLKEDICSAIERKCKLQHSIAESRSKQQRLRSELLKSRKKMMAFINATRHFEHRKPEFVATEDAKAAALQLKEKCRALSNQLSIAVIRDHDTDGSEGTGKPHRQSPAAVSLVNRRTHLERAKAELDAKRDMLETEAGKLESEIMDAEKQCELAVQSIQLVKKRQGARLTRLRRQVQDAQQRNHRWRTVASQYRQQIAMLRRDLQQTKKS